jgi:hypothetical protein
LPDSRPSSIIVGGLIRFIAGLISHIPLAGSGRRSGEIMIDSRELNRPSRAKRRAFAARRFRYLTRRELCVALVVMRLRVLSASGPCPRDNGCLYGKADAKGLQRPNNNSNNNNNTTVTQLLIRRRHAGLWQSLEMTGRTGRCLDRA